MEREAGGTLSPCRWSCLWCEPRVYMQRATHHTIRTQDQAQGVFSRWGLVFAETNTVCFRSFKGPLGEEEIMSHRSASKLWGIAIKGTRMKETLVKPFISWFCRSIFWSMLQEELLFTKKKVQIRPEQHHCPQSSCVTHGPQRLVLLGVMWSGWRRPKENSDIDRISGFVLWLMLTFTCCDREDLVMSSRGGPFC